MNLYIDTTQLQSVQYILRDNHNEVIRKVFHAHPHHSDELLEFLAGSGVLQYQEEIKKIIVNVGPGSYSGTRIGIAHAQALSQSLGVPVQELQDQKFKKSLL